jgi:hypothetical protein
MKAGLRLDQGPPFHIPLLFFLSAPLFLCCTGLYAAIAWDVWSASRWNGATLALTHLLALGFLGMAMLGALTQMAPVAAAAPMLRLAALGRISHGTLLFGAPLLAWGLTGQDASLIAGALLSSLSLLILALNGLAALMRAPEGRTREAMRIALLALLGAMLVALSLTGWLTGVWTPPDANALVDSHALLGLVGWIGVLVIGSAYQVVPMLQITPDYPAWTTRWLVPAIAALLGAWVALRLLAAPEGLIRLPALGMATGLTLFALTTLRLQARRKRKVGDATLRYWRLGMVSLIAACLLAGSAALLPEALSERAEILIGIIFLLGFATSVVNGMLLKIAPFLAWFHLQAQVGLRRTTLVGMKDFFPDNVARRQFMAHLCALALFLPSPWLPALAIPGGLCLALSALIMEAQLIAALTLFRNQGGRLAMP